jgi:hypothetical protein
MIEMTTATLNTKVTIDGEIFSLGEIPGEDSELVKSAKTSVLRNLDLDKLISGLERSADLLFLAYAGVSGFGELRAATNTLQDDLAKLCTEAEGALDEFRLKTVAVLNQLRLTFQWLTNGKENLALKFLAAVATTADKMAEDAEGLAKKFDELADRTREVCNKTEIQQGKTDQERRELQQKLNDLEAASVAAKKEAEALGELKAKMQELYEEAKQKAETAENRAFALAITSAILTPIATGVGAIAGAFAASQTRVPVPPQLPKEPPKSQEQEDKEKAETELGTARREEKEAGAKVEPAETAEADALKLVNEKQAEVDVRQNKLAEAKENRHKEKEPSKEKKKELDDAVTETEKVLEAAKDAWQKAKDDLDAKEKASEAVKRTAGEKAENARLKQAAFDAAAKALKGAAQQIDTAGKSYSDLAEKYETTRKDYLNKWLDFKQQEAKKLGEIEKYAVQMSAVKTRTDIEKTVSDSLVQAIKAFNEVSQILRAAAQFWHQMSSACAQLGAGSPLQQEIKLYAEELSSEERLAVYEEDDFKTKVVRYMSSWKALELVCDEYNKAVARTRERIGDNIIKSPSPAESIELTSVLAKKMIATAKGAQQDTERDIKEIEKAKNEAAKAA